MPTFLALSLLALSGQAPGAGVALPEPLPRVGLASLREEPLVHLGRRVRFVLQLRAPRAGFDPYLSRFGPTEWSAFEAWPDEHFTWLPEVFDDPARFVFARRGSLVEQRLAASEPYRRFEVVAVVREVFLDEPWIELESATPLSELVGEGTILHVTRAAAFFGAGEFELGLEQLERARAAPLPEHARAELTRLEADARAAMDAIRGTESP